jgi:hypothetical protein
MRGRLANMHPTSIEGRKSKGGLDIQLLKYSRELVNKVQERTSPPIFVRVSGFQNMGPLSRKPVPRGAGLSLDRTDQGDAG